MKFLHVTDLHARRRWFTWIAENAHRYDAVAITGDLVDIFSPEPLDSQVEWIGDWARTVRRSFFVCEGNHEADAVSAGEIDRAWLATLPGAVEFDDDGRAEVSGQTFVRVGWKGAVPALRPGDNHPFHPHHRAG